MTSYSEIFDNNLAWIETKVATQPDFFQKLSLDQKPDYLYIGCSDSRVTAEEMMGLQPGEAFVHRNVANLVVNTDLNVMSVINYAVRYLSVKHIIVCGHYNCGGVKAAMIPKDMGILNPWNLRLIIEQARVPIVVDAGVGTASDAAIAMELGCDAVLMNTAIAGARDPILMASAMKKGVEAGREAFLAGRMPKKLYSGAPSSPTEGLITAGAPK